MCRMKRSFLYVLIFLFYGLPVYAESPALPPSLVPPSGFTAAVKTNKDEKVFCPPAINPYTGSLMLTSKYNGSGPSRDQIDPDAKARFTKETADITQFEKQVSAMVAHSISNGHPKTLECLLNQMTSWSKKNALLSTEANHTGRAMRKWALASIASSFLRLTHSVSDPLSSHDQEIAPIKTWLLALAQRVVADWSGLPIEKTNNHSYWAAWSVMASAVLLDRRDLFDWALNQYYIAASQVDKEGYLDNEMKRGQRALSYHNYALTPLVMIAAFARVNQVPLAELKQEPLSMLAHRVLQGYNNPLLFEGKTGKKQNLDDVTDKSKFAWLEPYCWAFSCDEIMTQRVARLRPLKSYRLGGDITMLFACPPGCRPPSF